MNTETKTHEVVLVNENGQVQFRLHVEAPPNRIDAELLPLLNRGGEEFEGWRAERRS